MTPGDGTCLSPEDPDLLLATRPGLPCQERAGMRVDEVLNVKQVDIRHGHVEFEGSLLVTGDVMPGMRVKTSGDVVIGGFVEGGYIESGGTITVRNGIIGRKLADDEYLCHLNAGGEIHASYAQYARLEADGDIHILSQLSHCYCRSGQDLKVGDSAMRKGHLIGGINIANRLIMAPVLGASAANRTRLQILGGYFSQKEQELALRQRKQTCAEQIDKLQDLILRLLQLPRDKRNPETCRRSRRCAPASSTRARAWTSSSPRRSGSCRRSWPTWTSSPPSASSPASRWRWPITTTGSTSSTAPSTSPSGKISCN